MRRGKKEEKKLKARTATSRGDARLGGEGTEAVAKAKAEPEPHPEMRLRGHAVSAMAACRVVWSLMYCGVQTKSENH